MSDEQIPKNMANVGLEGFKAVLEKPANWWPVMVLLVLIFQGIMTYLVIGNGISVQTELMREIVVSMDERQIREAQDSLASAKASERLITTWETHTRNQEVMIADFKRIARAFEALTRQQAIVTPPVEPPPCGDEVLGSELFR